MESISRIQNQILVNDNLQHQLEQEGFVVVPFYSPEEIAQLSEFYTKSTHSNIEGFQPTTYFQSEEYRLKASEVIKKIARPHLEKLLQNYKVYMGSFIVKHNDKNSELGVHQDMTLVDETKFMGVNIWAPLCDTNEKNGALYLIPQSHKLFFTYRNATIPNIYDKHYDLIKKYMQPIYLKAGEAIIFDNSILHFSPINKSEKIRIATNIFVTHKDAMITICYHDKEKNKIELFEQEDTFFTAYKQFGNDANMLRPQIGRSIGFRDYDFPILTPQLLVKNYGKIATETFIDKIIKKIKGVK